VTAERPATPTVIVRRDLAQAEDVVVFLPPAGTVGSPYFDVGDHLPAWAAAAHCEMPGRGRLTGHRAPVSIPDAVECWQSELTGLAAGRRLHLFGHSLGALLAYELAGRIPVASLMISGARDPGSPARTLIGAAFAALQSGQSDTEADWFATDLRLRRGYRPPDALPRTPFALFAGRADTFVRPDEIEKWRQWINGPFLGSHLFAGGHDYYLHAPAPVADAIGQIVQRTRQNHTRTPVDNPQTHANGVGK
jgi:surfactin synthase thioesterase subunit